MLYGATRATEKTRLTEKESATAKVYPIGLAVTAKTKSKTVTIDAFTGTS
ncbi:MAG: hypothetical protein LBU34_11825 [Planctomycetaceae bacterium]|nr:hypothetical protein [Planctomycetaceae bacterium]